MHDQHRSRPRAYVSATTKPDINAQVELGIAWARGLGLGSVTVRVPMMNWLETHGGEIELTSLDGANHTSRHGRPFPTGVIVDVCPTPDFLEMDDPATTALCVVGLLPRDAPPAPDDRTLSADDIWLAAFPDAIPLGDPVVSASLAIDPIAAVAFSSLASLVNASTGFGHDSDKASRDVTVLRLLEAQVPFNANDASVVLLRAGFPGRFIADFHQRVNGLLRRSVRPHKRWQQRLRADIVEAVWRPEAERRFS